jgi:hypothetical protein
VIPPSPEGDSPLARYLMEHRYYARATAGDERLVHTAGLDRGEVKSSSPSDACVEYRMRNT